MLNADIPQARIPNLASRMQAIRLLPVRQEFGRLALGNLTRQEERTKGSNVLSSPTSAHWNHPMMKFKVNRPHWCIHSKRLVSVYTSTEPWVNNQKYYILEESLQNGRQIKITKKKFGGSICMCRKKKHQNYSQWAKRVYYIYETKIVCYNKITFGK